MAEQAPARTVVPYGPFRRPAEAASFLRKSERTLESDRRSGRGPKYLKLGLRGPIVYPQQFLDEYVTQHVRSSTKEDAT